MKKFLKNYRKTFIATTLTALIIVPIYITFIALTETKAQQNIQNKKVKITHNNAKTIIQKYQREIPLKQKKISIDINAHTEKKWLFGQNIQRKGKNDFIKNKSNDTLAKLIMNTGLVGINIKQNNIPLQPIQNIEPIYTILPINNMTMSVKK